MPRNDKIYTDVGNSFDLIKDGQLDEWNFNFSRYNFFFLFKLYTRGTEREKKGDRFGEARTDIRLSRN